MIEIVLVMRILIRDIIPIVTHGNVLSVVISHGSISMSQAQWTSAHILHARKTAKVLQTLEAERMRAVAGEIVLRAGSHSDDGPQLLAPVAQKLGSDAQLTYEGLPFGRLLVFEVALLPGKRLLEGPVVAEDAKLEVRLEEAELRPLEGLQAVVVPMSHATGVVSDLGAHVSLENVLGP